MLAWLAWLRVARSLDQACLLGLPAWLTWLACLACLFDLLGFASLAMARLPWLAMASLAMAAPKELLMQSKFLRNFVRSVRHHQYSPRLAPPKKRFETDPEKGAQTL